MRSRLLFTAFTAALSLSSFTLTPALRAAVPEGAERRQLEDEARPKFPMSASDFRQMIDARTARARQAMEACASTLPPEQASAVRATFDAGVVKIGEEVDKVTADGTVTKSEAKKVRDTAHSVHHDDPCKK